MTIQKIKNATIEQLWERYDWIQNNYSVELEDELNEITSILMKVTSSIVHIYKTRNMGSGQGGDAEAYISVDFSKREIWYRGNYGVIKYRRFWGQKWNELCGHLPYNGNVIKTVKAQTGVDVSEFMLKEMEFNQEKAINL